jgi:hypothetical protein
MTRQSTLSVLTGLTVGALVALSPATAVTARAADTTTTAVQGRTVGETTAIDAMAQAHRAVQQRQNRKALEEIERAETALLNLTQVERDVHVQAALQRLAAARESLQQRDLAAADQQLVEAAHTLSVAAAAPTGAGAQTARGPGAAQLVGNTVYDMQDQPLGSVVQVVADRSGDVAVVVIDVGDFVGDQGKTVGVVPGDLTTRHGHLTLDRSRTQLQEAQPYRGIDTGARSGSSAPPASRR